MRRAGDLRIDVALGSARKTYFNSLLAGVEFLIPKSGVDDMESEEWGDDELDCEPRNTRP